MSIKNWIRKLILGKNATSESYIAYLREQGVQIGQDVTIFVPSKTLIDVQYPWMITIGDHVNIAEGVKLITHDYSWGVLKRLHTEEIMPGAVLGASGRITIGNNVFIGMNAIITRGVTIGNNVIIGAGSVVTKDCLDDGVYAGAPAKRIAEIGDFYRKRQEAQLSEAKELAIAYYERFGAYPSEDVFHEYFMLFTKTATQNPTFVKKMSLCENQDESFLYLQNVTPPFDSFEDFLAYCFKN